MPADLFGEGPTLDVIPKIPGPWGEPPPVEEIMALGPSGVAIHAAGGILNVLVTGRAVVFLVRNANDVRRSWLLPLAGVAVGTFAADFVSGLLHWAFDTWFDESVEPMRRMVYLVREHHMRPARIFRYRLRDEAGLLSWFGVGLAAPLYRAARAGEKPVSPARYALAVTGVTLAAEVALMLEFHKWGHRVRRGRAPRLLQRAHVLLSPEIHLQHHSGNHDQNYCLITGIADQTLGRMGVFRTLERLVTALTNAEPRRDDHEWARRYGRPQ
ncbi:MAG TPA: fatty acid desaturase CarF family protein [Solirubrobacteraceae bacterium]|nr:fatty acid desaturase CarF family protein [Solirubrobacteraceae bacterium]